MVNETAPLVDSQITLRDGATLAYAEYGKPDGHPLFLLHGTPGARLVHPGAVMAGAANTRIITLDRPGYGRSERTCRGGMVERAEEVAQLADALGIERFAVIGVSGGGPYAAACGWRLPERVTAVGLISSPAPLPAATAEDRGTGISDEEVEAARTLSWLDFLEWFKEQQGNATLEVEPLMASFLDTMPACDKPVFVLPEVQGYFRLVLREAFLQGLEGWAWDSWTLARPWGFDVQDIGVRTYLWHGLEDRAVPVKQGEFLAQTIPSCVATFYPDTGHLLPPYRWNEILSAVVRWKE